MHHMRVFKIYDFNLAKVLNRSQRRVGKTSDAQKKWVALNDTGAVAYVDGQEPVGNGARDAAELPHPGVRVRDGRRAALPHIAPVASL